jgi:hypothetical protein
MNDLSQRLKDGVPTPPDATDLSGIAARSVADGRRRRTRRRFASVAAVVVLAAGGVALPRVLDDSPPDVAERSEPQCVATPDAPVAEVATQEATWVRFCDLPADEPGARARFPRGAVTGGVAALLVESWSEGLVDGTCHPETPPVPSRRFRIQIGLSDGGVTQVDTDIACDRLLFWQLETPLQGASRRDEYVEPQVPTCPATLTTMATNRDGAQADLLRDDADDPSLSTVPLLPGPSIVTDVCAYQGQGEDRTLVDQWRSQSASNAVSYATTGYADGEADCRPRPGATSYLVVMQDATGTARTFTLDMAACGEMRAATGTPPVDTYLGLATTELVRLVRDSKDPGSAG